MEINNEILLRNLGLYDGNYLNNAAILLFGKEPNKWILGSYIKIGFFENNDADLKIYVWNDAIFPEELKNKNLFEKHYSKPYNPLIAQTFFKAGFIESWGRGFEKIKDECKKDNL